MYEGQVLHTLAAAVTKLNAAPEIMREYKLMLRGPRAVGAGRALQHMAPVLIKYGARTEKLPWLGGNGCVKDFTVVKPDLLMRSAKGQHLDADALHTMLKESATELRRWNPASNTFDPLGPLVGPVDRVAMEITMSGSANGVFKIAQLERALWCCGPPSASKTSSLGAVNVNPQVAVLCFNGTLYEFQAGLVNLTDFLKALARKCRLSSKAESACHC